jgi:hypothetical protein
MVRFHRRSVTGKLAVFQELSGLARCHLVVSREPLATAENRPKLQRTAAQLQRTLVPLPGIDWRQSRSGVCPLEVRVHQASRLVLRAGHQMAVAIECDRDAGVTHEGR